MPIKIGEKKFKDFKAAAAHIRRTKPGVKDPNAYVAAIEQAQAKKKKKR